VALWVTHFVGAIFVFSQFKLAAWLFAKIPLGQLASKAGGLRGYMPKRAMAVACYPLPVVVLFTHFVLCGWSAAFFFWGTDMFSALVDPAITHPLGRGYLRASDWQMVALSGLMCSVTTVIRIRDGDDLRPLALEHLPFTRNRGIHIRHEQ
jgi:hypothetical protein